MSTTPQFEFTGGALSYIGYRLLGWLITVITFGICYPFAVVLMERWRCNNTTIDGHRLVFRGSALGLFGHWIKWLLLSIITLGIYLFWVAPRMQRWITENTAFVTPNAHVAVFTAGAAAPTLPSVQA